MVESTQAITLDRMAIQTRRHHCHLSAHLVMAGHPRLGTLKPAPTIT